MARLAGSTNLDPELIKFIYARVLLLPKIPKISRETLATALKYEIEAEERVNWRVPSHENLIKMISEARNHAPNHLDEPWSIAASLKYGIPPEANRDLFDIWRVSLAIDRPLSIRQARWIVYLRDVRPEDLPQNTYPEKVRRSLELISQSWLYSIRERVSEIMGEEHFDTTALDAVSFIPPWECNTAVKLGKVPVLMFSQEQLTKLGESGISLHGPPRSGSSVEQAVWHKVRESPPPGQEITDLGLGEEIWSEEDDIVSAYWLMYLSKGSKWDSLGYFEQRGVRYELRNWIKTHSNMSLRDYYSLHKQREKNAALIFNAMLLKKVGYEITPEDIELWFEFRKQQLKAQHKGYDQLLPDIQQRFIHDEQTPDDKEALERADYQVVLKQKQLEQEFIELVQHQGGAPSNKKGYKIVKDFWVSVRDEWVKKYPKYKKTLGGYLQWEEVQAEYERIIEEHKKGGTS